MVEAGAPEILRLRAELEAKAAQQAAVAAISRRALSGASLDDLLDEAVRLVADHLGADLVGFLARTDDPLVFTAVAGVGWPDEFAHDGRPMPVVVGGPTEWVLRHEHLLVTGDLHSDERFVPSPVLLTCGVHSSIVVTIGSPPVGILGAHSRQAHSFRPADADFVVAVAGVVAAARERQLAEASVRRLALYDGLTGLPNRSLFTDRLDQALRERNRTGRDLALLMLDLDRFKQVNDTLGHHVGDLLLIEVGRRLATSLRAADTVARLGGDEFAILLPNLAHADEHARLVAAKVGELLARPFEIEGALLPGESSIGIALAPLHGTSRVDLFKRADAAMYRAKRSGTGWALWDADRDAIDEAMPTLAGELFLAIDNGELECMYQPVFELPSRQVVGVEALVRWRHPQRGLLLPAQFVPAAEHTGAIGPLSWWVFDEAATQIRRWRAEGRPLQLAINCSGRLLADPALADRVKGVLTAHGLAPADLVLEVSESGITAHPEHALAALRRLGECGVGIAIDDFGAGPASLSRLIDLPATEVKVDPRLVAGIDTDPRRAALVRALVNLAHELGMVVTAEGVEGEAQLAVLTALGCDRAQGYLLGPPVPAAGVARTH